MEELLLILGVVTFLFALLSARFDNSFITPPMVYYPEDAPLEHKHSESHRDKFTVR